jgi:quercetin dioxygenase-like cupin family protein
LNIDFKGGFSEPPRFLGVEMSVNIRRVVTGHDAKGKAVVQIDEMCKFTSGRRNHQACVVWSTGSFPTDCDDPIDGGTRTVGFTDPNGTVFRIVHYEPNVEPRNHRTESIDYAIVMDGEIDMDIDGEVIHLKQGDVLIQRGTIHNWINRGDTPCTIAFILVAAEPVKRGDKAFSATG